MNAGERDDSVYQRRRLRFQNAVVVLDNATIALSKSFTFKRMSFKNAELNAQTKLPSELNLTFPTFLTDERLPFETYKLFQVNN